MGIGEKSGTLSARTRKKPGSEPVKNRGSHGGAREGAGRHATGARQVGVTLDPATVMRAREIGGGNVSEGLRRAVAAFQPVKNSAVPS